MSQENLRMILNSENLAESRKGVKSEISSLKEEIKIIQNNIIENKL